MNKVKKIERLSEIVSKFYKIGKFKSANVGAGCGDDENDFV